MSELKKLTQQVREIYAAYEDSGTNKWTYETALIDLSYQVGSLSKIMLQIRGDRFAEEPADKLTEQIGDELADVLAEILFIADELGIDLQEYWANMLNSDREKISNRTKSEVIELRAL